MLSRTRTVVSPRQRLPITAQLGRGGTVAEEFYTERYSSTRCVSVNYRSQRIKDAVLESVVAKFCVLGAAANGRPLALHLFAGCRTAWH